MGNLKYIILLGILFIGAILFAQEKCTYRGMVIDSLDIPVYDAAITAFDVDNASAGYTFSDNEGEFKLEMECGKQYEIEIEHMSYEPKLVKVDLQKSFREKIILKSSKINLKDVVAKGRVPIKMKGDTIEYDAASFMTGNEEDLEDILKKLPGIEVEDGKVYYQGKQINSIKVEGREIFGGNTKLLTKNLPSDAVDKIQLNKKFKANPFANSLQDEEQPELNIVLKEDKKSLIFGNLTIGGDAKEHYDLQTKLFRFSPKTDAALISDFNTYGKEVFSMEDYFQFLGGVSAFMEEGGSNALRNSMQNIMFGSGQKATTMKNHLGAFHFGYEPKEKLHITAFALATDNNLNYKSTTERIYSDFTQRDENTNDQNILSIVSRLKVDYNINPRSNLKYTLNFNQQEEENFSDINSYINDSTEPNIFRNATNERENTLFSQQLSYIRKVGQDDNFGLYITHSHQKETPNLLLKSSEEPFAGFFDFTLTGDAYILNENQALTSNTIQGLAVYNHLITNLSNIRIKLGANINRQELENKIYDDSFLLQNDFTPTASDFDYNELYADATYTRKIEKFTVDIGTGLHKYISENRSSLANSNLDIVRVLPHLTAKYEFTTTQSIRLNYNQTYEIPQIRELTEGYDIQNYFSIYRGTANLKEAQYHKANLSYYIFNYFKFFNMNLSVNYSKKLDNIRNEGYFNEQIQYTSPFNSSMPEDNWSVYLNVRKRLTKQYTIKLKGNASISTFGSRNNAMDLENTSTMWSGTLTNIYKFRKKFEIEFGLNYLQSDYENQLQDNKFVTWKPFATSAWMVTPDLLFQLDYDYRHQLSNGEKLNGNHDLELKLRYKPAKKVYTYLTVGNLLNNDKVVTNSFNDFYTVINTRNTLGRYILAQIKYKF